MLERLEVENFKSYKGKQIIGPFLPFTCIIGPNGAGKSNAMDAISFVLGVRSQQLRSSQLKDLIYRGGNKYNADDPDAQDRMDDAVDQDRPDQIAAKSASVTAIYKDPQGQEWRYQRLVTVSGSSEYRINGKTITFAKYNAALEEHNILVKAKNFLVFQGDVEQVAQQSPKDLSKLIEQISGSGDLKDEYDQTKAASEKANENSTAAFNKRKGFNTEIKQFKEQKAEALRFDELRQERDEAIVHHLVWKLYHLGKTMEAYEAAIENLAEEVDAGRAEHAEQENKLKVARKEQGRVQKEVAKQEKEVKKRERDQEELRPTLLEIETKIAHAAKKIKTNSAVLKDVERDRNVKTTVLASLKKDLKDTQKLAKEQQDKTRKASQEQGLNLSEDDLKDYRDLKIRANTRAVSERQQLTSHKRDARAKRDALATINDRLEQASQAHQKLKADETSLSSKRSNADAKVKSIQTELTRVKKDLNDAQIERTKTNQTMTELNEKLQECVTKLMHAGAEQRESERETKLKETVANLRKNMPGKVLGRVMELVKPSQRKYDTAVAVVLGRNIDAIVVDTEQTAVACIQDMRNARAGTATFLPLDTLQAKPVNDRFRNLSSNARLALDVITYDRAIEKAAHFACGNALICDTLDVARYVCYEKGEEVKAVTLDGTVFHKAGLITGGAAASAGGRRWDENQVESLRLLETTLKSQLADISKNRPRQNHDDVLQTDLRRLEQEVTAAKDDLNAFKTRLNGIKAELAARGQEMQDLTERVAAATQAANDLSHAMDILQTTISDEERGIYAGFCKRLGIADIQEYEETRLSLAQEQGAAELKLKTQMARLEHQIGFEQQQLDTIEKRIAALQSNVGSEQVVHGRLTEEKAKTEAEIETVEAAAEALRDGLKRLEDEASEKSNEVEKIRKQNSKASAKFNKATKEIASFNGEIEKAASERFSLYRKAKLEEIDLPLLKKSAALDSVPIEENLPINTGMDIDGEEEEALAAIRTDTYDIHIDFGELDGDEIDDRSNTMEQTLLTAITDLNENIQNMSPNMRAIDKLDEIEAKLAATDNGYNKVRREAKDAKDAFNAVRKRRSDLFNKAYEHIAEKIDVVYKELTKGKASPMGGVAYLSLEESEEPYLHGIKYHAMPPMKRFRDMDQLSGGEKTMAALALLFAVHSFHPSPFFVLDEVDAALDNTNVGRIARYVRSRANEDFQFVVISLKGAFYEKAQGLCGIWRDVAGGSSRSLTLDLEAYA